MDVPASETRSAVQRHIVTCEFPPKTGGVSDYTYQLARDLALAGDDIHIWCPESRESDHQTQGLTIHGELRDISVMDLCRVDAKINRFLGTRRILVQWVPHGYKYKSLNLPFCLWVLKRAAINRDVVELMIHEPFLRFRGENWRHTAAAGVHRAMIIALLAASKKVWLSTSSWEQILRPYCLGRQISFQCLPIPSNIPVFAAPLRVSTVRRLLASQDQVVVGHFGTYGRDIAGTLTNLLPMILESNVRTSFVLIGSNSDQFRKKFLSIHPALRNRVYATGSLESRDLSAHIQSCDLMIQPYSDGITTRRTSAMVSLVHGRALVTTCGHLTESLWRTSGAVAMEPPADLHAIAERALQLASDGDERRRLGEAARLLYSSRFDLCHTIKAIKAGDEKHRT